jgi:hypothetical protein
VTREATSPSTPTDASETLFVGIDEAGYGPNLGPLVIGCVAFRGPSCLRGRDWWSALAPTIRRWDKAEGLCIDDSKQLLGRRGGWERLTEAVHAFALAAGCPTCELVDLFAHLCVHDLDALRAEHWFEAVAGQEEVLPKDVAEARASLVAELAVELVSLQARVAFPAQFNRRLAELGTKADVEIELIRELLTSQLGPRQWVDGSAQVQGASSFGADRNGRPVSSAVTDRNVCPTDAAPAKVVAWVDRLGGRRYYRPLVEDIAGDAFVATIEESPSISRYRYEREGREFEIEFVVRGDHRHLPVALASMLAKYLRERTMAGLNRFWTSRVPGLLPTAGYPQDARRFLADIRPRLAEVAVPLDSLWRRR